MNKTITVKGIGRVSARPDHVVISMQLESRDKNYERAMQHASECIELLTSALADVGFTKDSVKTTNFYVSTSYDSVRRKDGSYERVFMAYVVSHSLKVEFDFEPKLLSNAISAVGACLAHPNLSIDFTVKDPAEISEELLRSAASNARRKADVLCAASGKRLGELLSIDYNWGELNIHSPTSYVLEDECIGTAMPKAMIDFEPDEIDLRDSAAFVWEII